MRGLGGALRDGDWEWNEELEEVFVQIRDKGVNKQG
jgi:hypothetical protein